ncbi:MAG: Phage anti-repressor protein [Candidatus Accumulibacter regalis]|uniref:Phage anti-repressor protein n=1 Tax=Accumulibacter regalis TaxID=522306 RepID=A0A011R349_ACCRE|nr:MAG: Phage anti-repressor protein [Candidatus Accumulibacter regalis]
MRLARGKCRTRVHAALGVGRDFATWIKQRIAEYGFAEGEDFSPIRGKSRGGRPAADYHLTIDMAKELAMVENNDTGRRIRRYFIALEKRQAAALAIPATPSMNLRRWLISFDHLGREHATPIGMDESIVKWDELPALIRDPGFMIEGRLLAEIVHACADRMSRKLAGGANQVSA